MRLLSPFPLPAPALAAPERVPPWPGGGYGGLAADHEDTQPALFFNPKKPRTCQFSIPAAALLTGLFAAGTPSLRAAPETPSAPAVDKDFLRIGSWNVENLGYRSYGRNAPIASDQQAPENLADYILSSKVDVLAIQEVHDDDQKEDNDKGAAPWKNKTMDKTLELLQKGTGDEWEYLLTDPEPVNVRSQLTGVLWRKSRATFKGRIKPDIKGGEHNGQAKLTYWTRRPEAFHFSAGDKKSDFTLVPMHMKSNSGGNETARAMRKEEALQMLDAIKKIEGNFTGEKDIVLLGDTNILAPEQSVQETWAGFTDLNAADMLTWMNPEWINATDSPREYPPAPFDRIFVPTGQPEFAKSAQKVHGPYAAGGMTEAAWTAEHVKLRSDHLLVWCDIAISTDDD